MSKEKPDIEPAKTPAASPQSDSVALMEPMLVGESARGRAQLADLTLDLAARSEGFKRSLPGAIVKALSDLVRSMNCYYSNLIEGHDTHPIDIERALKADYSADAHKRDLQLEARAHIAVQQWIDEEGLKGRATTADGVLEVHRRFCELLPDSLLWVENPETGERIRVTPGELRRRHVKVGRHIPPDPDALPRFMRRFEEAYSRLGRVNSVIAAATAHHRLLWIHPFLDGNGRVARLMSYSILRDALDTGGLWSIARGLARNEADYKSHLMACDQTRRNDLDGRGHLSEEALTEFAKFFLTVCIDQVAFMEGLVQPQRLRDRIMVWAQEEMRADAIPEKSDILLEAILYRGELPRGEAAALLGASERTARRTTSALLQRGVLASDSTRAPLRLAFPAALATRWMPGLFPDKAP